MHKPNAQILSYPVITSGEFAHKDSFKNLTGTDDEVKHLWSSLSLERRITDIIPPTFYGIHMRIYVFLLKIH